MRVTAAGRGSASPGIGAEAAAADGGQHQVIWKFRFRVMLCL